MSLVITTPPAIEPVSLTQAKAFLRVDGTAEDTLINSLISAARLHIETLTGLALIEQQWTFFLDRWPKARVLYLPIRPLLSIETINITDTSGTLVLWSADNYDIDANARPPRLLPAQGKNWLAPGSTPNGIEIKFKAGFGAIAADVPANLHQAVKFLMSEWFEHRLPMPDRTTPGDIPPLVENLLRPYRIVNL